MVGIHTMQVQGVPRMTRTLDKGPKGMAVRATGTLNNNMMGITIPEVTNLNTVVNSFLRAQWDRKTPDQVDVAWIVEDTVDTRDNLVKLIVWKRCRLRFFFFANVQPQQHGIKADDRLLKIGYVL